MTPRSCISVWKKMATNSGWDDFYMGEDFDNLDFDDDFPAPDPPGFEAETMPNDGIDVDPFELLDSAGNNNQNDENSVGEQQIEEPDAADPGPGTPQANNEQPKKKQRTKRVVPKKRTQRFQQSDATDKATQLVGDVLREIPSTPIFLKPFLNVKLSLILVTSLLAAINGPAFAKFSIFLVTELWHVLIEGDNKPLLYAQTLVENYHDLRVRSSLLENWDLMLDTLNIVRGDMESNCVLQHILEVLLEKLLTMRNAVDLPILEHTITIDKMNTQEEEVLNYVSGYIPFALRKHYKKMIKNVTAQKYVDVLSSWSTDGPYKGQFTFLEYTRKWIEAQNRGRLFQPNAHLYIFFRACENETRKHLNTAIIGTYRDMNLNELLTGKIVTSHIIQQYWKNLINNTNLSCTESVQLFKVTVTYFVTIRVRAFVIIYTDCKKLHDKTISKRGTRSLRQQLNK